MGVGPVQGAVLVGDLRDRFPCSAPGVPILVVHHRGFREVQPLHRVGRCHLSRDACADVRAGSSRPGRVAACRSMDCRPGGRSGERFGGHVCLVSQGDRSSIRGRRSRGRRIGRHCRCHCRRDRIAAWPVCALGRHFRAGLPLDRGAQLGGGPAAAGKGRARWWQGNRRLPAAVSAYVRHLDEPIHARGRVWIRRLWRDAHGSVRPGESESRALGGDRTRVDPGIRCADNGLRLLLAGPETN